MDPQRMISWRQYGYRMIGSADERAAHVRRRYLGASAPVLNLTPYQRSGTTTTGAGGESVTFTPAPAPPPPRHVVFNLGPPPAPPPPRHVPLNLGPPPAPYVPPPITTALALTAPAPPAPVPVLAPAPIAATPDCPSCAPKVVFAAGAGGIAGALLMYVVGLATREAKKKGRRR